MTHYVPMLIIYIYIYIYMLGLALITLLSLSPYVENSYKDFFGVNYFLIGAEGRIDFPRIVRQQNLIPPVVTSRSYKLNHFTCCHPTSPFYCFIQTSCLCRSILKNNVLNQVKRKNLICLLENNVGEGGTNLNFLWGRLWVRLFLQVTFCGT